MQSRCLRARQLRNAEAYGHVLVSLIEETSRAVVMTGALAKGQRSYQ